MAYLDDIRAAAALNLPWDTLRGCNILVTGATGLIGFCLVEVLMSRPEKDFVVYSTGRDEARAKAIFRKYESDPAFHFFLYDILNPLKCDIEFQYIIHAASNASPNFFVMNPVEIMKSNIYGLVNLLEYGRTHGLNRLLFVSSGEIYGEGDGSVFDENDSGYVNPVSPRSCYPSSKRAAETLCVSYGVEYGIDTVIARPCHIYGPYFTESDNRVYAQFIRNVSADQDIVMKSDGVQFRSWCYVVDCVSAILYILLKGVRGEAYNIADDASNISIRELAEMIAEIGGKKVIFDVPSDLEKCGYNVVNKSLFSTVKIRSLGWEIESTMKEKMISTIMEAKAKRSYTI